MMRKTRRFFILLISSFVILIIIDFLFKLFNLDLYGVKYFQLDQYGLIRVLSISFGTSFGWTIVESMMNKK